jgi:putative drug exporter of the RND superfamily
MAALARWFYRHRRLVVAAWAAALVALIVASRIAGSEYKDSFSLPNTDSQSAYDLLARHFPQQAGESDTIVWKALSGTVDAAAVRARIDPMLASVAGSAQVDSVSSPYTAAGRQQISADRTVAFATVTFNGRGNDIATPNVQRVVDVAQSADSPAVQVELGGQTIADASQSGALGISALIGVIAAAVILFVAFGSALAMALPLVTAGVALGVALSLIALLSHTLSIAAFSSSLTVLIGLGVGVDYALFVVTRHRANLRRGMSVEEAAINALNTSGRAVLFAGTTVCIALLGLLVLRVSFLNGVAVAASVGVAVTMLAAVSLLPALLGFLGMRVLSRRQRRALRASSPSDMPDGSGFWHRWARGIERRPVRVAVLAIVVMGALAVPFFSIRLGSSDQGNDPTSTTTRRAYDLLAQGFGPGFNGPLQIVASVPSSADGEALAAFRSTVASTTGVAGVTSPQLSPDGRTAILLAYPTSSPQDQATTDLIDHVRNDLAPAAVRGTDMQIFVGGQTATFQDFATVLAGKLPLFIAVVVTLAVLLLIIAFRSLVVPVTAAIMNLLSTGAAFGVVVLVFQKGWLGGPLGIGREGPIDAFLPVFLFAILFGLSMDYEVFLVSRMHEEWVHTRDNRRAVTLGQGETGRVVTAAALIMASVFLSFAFGDQRVIKLFGIGLGAGVLLDAFVVRTLLVPSLMHVLGKANWYLPAWLDRALPRLSIEPDEEASTVPRQPSFAPGAVVPDSEEAEAACA